MVKAVLFGVGATAQALAQYATEKGVQIVAVFSRTSGVGEDAGSVLGLGRELGFKVSSNPASDIGAAKAQVALIATQSSVGSQEHLIKLSLEHGLDVLSLAEEGFYPLSDAQAKISELNAAAKSAGKSVFFGGVQDVFWYQALVALTGASQQISGIAGYTLSDLEDLGTATLEQYPLGYTSEQFEQYLQDLDSSEAGLVVVEPAMEAVLQRLGVKATQRSRHVEPIFAKQATPCETLALVIQPGTTCGLSEVITFETDSGFSLRVDFAAAVLLDGEFPLVRWTVEGEPTLHFESKEFPGYEVTASSLVNRIPDILAADAGYKTVLDLPMSRWWKGVSL